jgi:hypothetical protein
MSVTQQQRKAVQAAKWQIQYAIGDLQGVVSSTDKEDTADAERAAEIESIVADLTQARQKVNAILSEIKNL